MAAPRTGTTATTSAATETEFSSAAQRERRQRILDGFVWGGSGNVSCNSASACTAVVSSFYRTVTEAWNGTSWSLEYPPGPGGSHRILSDVSCVPAGGCTAVGHYDGPTEELTLAAAKP